jgi:hypothetical protein
MNFFLSLNQFLFLNCTNFYPEGARIICNSVPCVCTAFCERFWKAFKWRAYLNQHSINKDC